MKKSFSLIEVIISTVLLSAVVLALFQVKENNITIVKKYKEIDKNTNYILLALNPISTNNDEKIYLEKSIKVEDDDLFQYLKDKIVYVKKRLVSNIEIEKENSSLKVSEFINSYSLEEGSTRNIYRFKLEL